MPGQRGFRLRGTNELTDSTWVRQLFRLSSLCLLAACDRGSPTFDTVETGPKVKVQLTIPEADAVDVPVDQSIRVQFDRFLSPLSVTRQSFCIASVGPMTRGSLDDCETYPAPEYDPVDRVAVWKLSQPLKPGVRYTVTLRPPEDQDHPDGIRAFDGAPLEAPYVFSFVTERRQPCGEDESCPDGTSCRCEGAACERKTCQRPSNEPARHVDYCATPRSLCALPATACEPPRSIPATRPGPRTLLHGCAGSTCHSSNARSRSSSHAQGNTLVLTNDGIRDYLGKVALETATGGDPTAINRLGVPFGVNMPYVDPGFPANSYLLWKLVLGLEGRDAHVVEPTFSADGYRCEDLSQLPQDAGPDGECPRIEPPSSPLVRAGDVQPGIVEPWIPPSMSRPIAEGEYERLRRSLRGHGMPLGRSIDAASVRGLQAWIAAGAPVTDCEPR